MAEQDIICGRNSVREALRSERTVNKVYISRNARGTPVEEIIKLARQRGVPVHHVPPEKLDNFRVENNQGIVAEVAPIPYLDLAELWERIKTNEKPLIVILDSIEDPHNLGAIIRNAVAFGAHGVVIGKWRSAALNETVVRASAGAIAHIPIARVTNIAESINELKELGVWIAGTDTAGTPLRESSLAFPLAVVIGSEGEGMHDLVKKRCDFLVSIPQTSTISSINASCAAAIVLYEMHLLRNK